MEYLLVIIFIGVWVYIKSKNKKVSELPQDETIISDNQDRKAIKTKVVGVTFETNLAGINRQQVISEFCEDGGKIYLLPEPENPVDENAILVLVDDGEGGYFDIGCLKAELAAEIATSTIRNKKVDFKEEGKILQVSGWDKKTLGVNIEIYYDKLKEK